VGLNGLLIVGVKSLPPEMASSELHILVLIDVVLKEPWINCLKKCQKLVCLYLIYSKDKGLTTSMNLKGT
jgi:hypothetical protein